jgi:hypothetical protein
MIRPALMAPIKTAVVVPIHAQTSWSGAPMQRDRKAILPQSSKQSTGARSSAREFIEETPALEGVLTTTDAVARSGPLDHETARPAHHAALLRAQKDFGNQHVARMLTQRQPAIQRWPPIGGHRGGGGGGAAPPAAAPAPAWVPAVPAPAPIALIPFSTTPVAAPGERIIYNSRFQHAQPNLFQLEYTAVGGTFDTNAGPTNKTVAGLTSGNLDFIIGATWNGTTPVTVRLDVRRIATNAVVHTTTWTYSRKTFLPTTIHQQEPGTERPLGSVYTYRLGPPRNHVVGGYQNLTILERFGRYICNISLADLRPAWRTAHGINTVDDITRHFFGDSGSNGTFTVNNQDEIYDGHGGGVPDLADVQAALVTMKEIHADLPQVYEVTPGVEFARYTVRRILKVDGSKAVRKYRQVD